MSPTGGTAGIDDFGTRMELPHDQRAERLPHVLRGHRQHAAITIFAWPRRQIKSIGRESPTESAAHRKSSTTDRAGPGPCGRKAQPITCFIRRPSGYKWYSVTSSNGISWGTPTQCTGTLGTEVSSRNEDRKHVSCLGKRRISYTSISFYVDESHHMDRSERRKPSIVDFREQRDLPGCVLQCRHFTILRGGGGNTVWCKPSRQVLRKLPDVVGIRSEFPNKQDGGRRSVDLQCRYAALHGRLGTGRQL